MLTGTKVDNTSLNGLLDKLAVRDEFFEISYETPTREDYMALVDAALKGKLEGVVSVGRSGIYLNKRLIHPPAET